MSRPLVVAHRGHSARFPENTVAAYRGAIAAGADLVETDARLTADGIPVAVHDADLARIAGADATVADTACADLLAMARARGVEVPTLEEALSTICPARDALIDVKTADLAIIDAIVAVLRRLGVTDRVWIGVRDAGQAAHARRHLPDVRVLAFLPDGEDPRGFADAGAAAFRIWEGALDGPAAGRLFASCPVWVTTGGKGTGRRVGDVGADELRGILARRPGAVLLNDPDLMVGLTGTKAS